MDFKLAFLTCVCSITTCFAKCPYPEQPEIELPQNDTDRCVTVTYDEPTQRKTYYDNERIEASMSGNLRMSLYSAFTGFLNFSENTPQYCFNKRDELENFNFIIDNKITNKMRARAEFVTCRSDGFWTNGKDFCNPPECNYYIQNSSVEVYRKSFSLYLNMDDVNAINISGQIRFLSFNSPVDPRFVFNLTSNTTELLETNTFLAMCSKHGPCRKGRFQQLNDLWYAKGGYPTLTIQKDGKSNTLFIALRHDRRQFVTRAKDDPCPMGISRKSGVCTSSFGTQSFQKLLEIDLPFREKWLRFTGNVVFAHKEDCRVYLQAVGHEHAYKKEVFLTRPCGRYSDMKRGNYPFEKIGIFTDSLQASFKMSYSSIYMHNTAG